MSIWTCALHAFRRKREQEMSSKDKKEVQKRMQVLADNWTSLNNNMFNNVKDAKWNNFETFEWLWEKYTKKKLNPTEFPVNFKDVRKFEAGLHYYNQQIANPRGYFASKWHLPRAAMQNVPELMRFEKELVNETSFYRDYTNETSRQTNDFLKEFQAFTLAMSSKYTDIRGISSGGQRRLKKLQDEYTQLRKLWLSSTDKKKIDAISLKLRANRGELIKFYNTGSGKAFELINTVLQGADIDTLRDLNGNLLDNAQKARVNSMLQNYNLIRKAGVTSMIRGLQQIKKLAKGKRLQYVDGTVERINGLIKAMEFQHTIDENGVVTDYKNLQSESDFIQLGFKSGDRYSNKGNVKFSKHYMSQYSLGLLDTIKKLENSIHDNKLSLDKKIQTELDSWESIINVAKNRSPIINPIYDNDPYFFLKKYTNDVGVFNYKAHVKGTFKKAIDAITNEHLKPAKEKGRDDLAETAEDMKQLLFDVYSEIQHVDPNADKNVSEWMRAMTSLTYFRLMGGNVRSAARNATQRLYEWVEFGLRASAPFVGQAQRWYKQAGGAENNRTKLDRQLKRFGLQWYDGTTRRSNAWEALTGKDENISQASRGALEEAHMKNKTLYVDSNGELAIMGGEKPAERVARITGKAAALGGKLHKIVEDWNRSKTFRIGFSLAHQNLMATSNTFKAQEILKKDINKIKEKKGKNYQITYDDLQAKYGSETQKVIDNWVENQAGQMAYNSALDLHFEYAKWNKAKAIKATSEDSKALGLAKMGLGQFAHYRFNMVNLMYKWAKEAGISLKAGDLRSEEFMRPLRFAFVQAMMFAGTLAARTNFTKLAPNDVLDTADIAYKWLTTDRNDPEQLAELDQATYGQGGTYFLGPNVGIVLSLYEWMTHTNMGALQDEEVQFAHEASLKKAYKKDEQQDLYKTLSMFNSQLARFTAYTLPVWNKAGLKDAVWLELGLFASQEQKEWRKWADNKLGLSEPKRGRKKNIKQSTSPSDARAIMKALDRLG